jgi:hypothetical protein
MRTEESMKVNMKETSLALSVLEGAGKALMG